MHKVLRVQKFEGAQQLPANVRDLGLGEPHGLMQALVREGDGDFSKRGALAEAIGARPDRQRQFAAIELARAVVAESLQGADLAALPVIADTHTELSILAAQAPTYNYDPGLLVMEIGGLLAKLGAPSARSHG